MRQRILAACALALTVLLAAGCASSSSGAGATGAGQGVRGTVVVGPTCPVERVESPCPDRPIAATVVATGPSGDRVASVRSAADGSFSIPLPPGRYTLAADAGEMRFARPVEVEVREGAWTRAVVRVDSGIR